jgi:co-chaperonin GroES (HSP10)
MATFTMGDKVNFTFYNYNEGLFMDEKKKRFMDFKDMDRITYARYKGQFQKVDLTKLFITN